MADGTTYTFGPETTDADLSAFWLAPKHTTFVAERAGEVVGCYVIRANQPGRGSHVANAAYAVLPGAQGSGVGRLMGEHSLEQARSRGFSAMQFNFVVSTNTRAIAVWESLGFKVVGRLPEVFQHPQQGLVDALVMHRFL